MLFRSPDYSLEEWQVVYRYGERLLQKRNPTLDQYLFYRIGQYETILENLQNQRKETAEKRREEIKTELRYAKAALKDSQEV